MVEKENVDPANRLSPDRAVPTPVEEESMPSDEMVQKVEIKIEDSEELREEEDDQMDLKEMDEDNPELMLRYKYSEGEALINPIPAIYDNCRLLALLLYFLRWPILHTTGYPQALEIMENLENH